MSNSTSMSFGPEWMRPKPTPASSKQNDNSRIHNNSGTARSPVSSVVPPMSNNAPRGGKIPWSGIAAGAGSGSANSNTPMSFASAATLSMSRSTNSGGRSSIGSPSLTRSTSSLQRSQLGGTGTTSASNQSIPLTARSKWDESKDSDPYQQDEEKQETTTENVLLENSGGRNYTVDEMLSIWEEMKRNNAIKPSIEQKNDLFHSILPNQPAVLDPSLQHSFFQESQHQQQQQQQLDSVSNGDAGVFGIVSHSNQSSISTTSNLNGNPTPFADRLLSAKPSLSELHKENGMSQHKSIAQSDSILNSPASSIVLPGVTNSSWSPFGASSTSLATNSESVFKSNGILPKNDFFSSGVGFHTSTPPPGISSPIQTFISPENINWIYKDPSGVDQGPFNGVRMQEWYSSKWLQETLLIRRIEETEFYTLKDYMTRVNNFHEPFLVPQPPVARGGSFMEDNQQRLQEELMARQREAIRRQQLQQFSNLQLQSQNSGWGSMSPITTPMSPMSHWSQPQLSQPQPLSSLSNSNPFEFSGLSGSQVNLAHLNNDVWQPRAPGSIPQTPRRVPSVTDLNASSNDMGAIKRSLLSELEDADTHPNLSSHKDLGFDNEEFAIPKSSPTLSQTAIQPPSKAPPAEIEVTTQEVVAEPPRPVAEEPEQVKEEKKAVSEVPSKKVKPSKTKGKKSVPVSGQQTPSVSRSAVPKVDKLAEELTKELEYVQIKEEAPEFESQNTESPVLSPKPTAPVLAPWAKKEASKSKAPSLKEIQEMEAAERKTRKAQQQQQAAATALLQASRSGTSTPVPSAAPALPSGATWATVGVSSPSSAPKKTLAQIQKEEEEAARKRNPASSASASNVRRYVDIAAPSNSNSYSSRTSAPPSAATAPSVGGAWTTVGPGGKKVGSASASTPASIPAVVASPTVHRKPEHSVRVAAAPPVPAPGIKLSPSSEEFLNWCKASLQDLQTGVNQNELLSMLFSLPSSSESKEIIAETIYSSSTTMDGRRFAEEFLKRRKSADNEISGNFTWSDILQKTSTASKPVNDGWNVSFKVVGKKKGRRE